MAKTVQITCISKSDRRAAHERIERVGGAYMDGSHWSITLDEAVRGAESGRWRFYTQVRGRFVWVVVATLDDRKYLKTEGDGEQPNNLLALPECP